MKKKRLLKSDGNEQYPTMKRCVCMYRRKLRLSNIYSFLLSRSYENRLIITDYFSNKVLHKDN